MSENRDEPIHEISGLGERLVYVMPEEALQAFARDELSLLEVWRIFWLEKWTIILVTAAFAIGSIIYALIATEWYRAEVLLAPAEQSNTSSLSGTLGSLASLAGVSVSGTDSAEALAVLSSREFSRSFIEDLNLMPVFFDSTEIESSDIDIRDGVKYFNDNVRTVSEDRDTSLVTLAIEWTNPTIAAEWANLLVERLNDRMRQRALSEAETNLVYLKEELGQTSIVTLQQSIGRLMETELQKLMLARGNEQFAFRIIDPAQVPKVRSRPARTLTVVIATFVGGLLAVLIVIARRFGNVSARKNTH